METELVSLPVFLCLNQQCKLSCFAQASARSALPRAAACEGKGKLSCFQASLPVYHRWYEAGDASFLCHCHDTADEGQGQLSEIMPIGPAYLHPCNQDQLYCATQVSYGSCSAKCYSL